MANAILNAGNSTFSGPVRYFSQAHHTDAQRVALHTEAVNALTMAGWHLKSDSGSVRQAITKAEQALTALRRLQKIGGAA